MVIVERKRGFPCRDLDPRLMSESRDIVGRAHGHGGTSGEGEVGLRKVPEPGPPPNDRPENEQDCNHRRNDDPDVHVETPAGDLEVEHVLPRVDGGSSYRQHGGRLREGCIDPLEPRSGEGE